jgi:hypothetical protein
MGIPRKNHLRGSNQKSYWNADAEISQRLAEEKKQVFNGFLAKVFPGRYRPDRPRG